MTPKLFLQRHSNEGERIAWILEVMKIPVEFVFISPLFPKKLENETGQINHPALQTDNRLYVGRYEILRWLVPQPGYDALFPTEVIAQATLDALLYFADERLSPLTQRIHHRLLIDNSAEFDQFYLEAIPASFRPWVRQLTRYWIKRRLDLNKSQAEKDERELDNHLKFVRGFLEGRSYCFENRFTMADITLCSYLYPLLYHKRFSEGAGESLLRWVTHLYKKHRQNSIHQPIWHPAERVSK